MRLTNSARQEAGLFQNIQTVPLCWNGAESLLAVAAGSRGHLTASPAMVTGAVAEMPSTLPPAVRVIRPHLAPCPRPAKGSWHAATHGAPSRAMQCNVSQAPHCLGVAPRQLGLVAAATAITPSLWAVW